MLSHKPPHRASSHPKANAGHPRKLEPYNPMRSHMLSGLVLTLKRMQGIPGWPQLYGLGCCEYRLNATHAAPVLVDARQPLQVVVVK